MATFSVKDLQDRYGVGEHTVLAWIARGELKAINVARTQGVRPKWRITQSALDGFEALRETSPKPEQPARKRGKPTSHVVEFFK